MAAICDTVHEPGCVNQTALMLFAQFDDSLFQHLLRFRLADIVGLSVHAGRTLANFPEKSKKFLPPQ